MTTEQGAAYASGQAIRPEVRKITPHDIKDALAHGLADFNAHPSHVVFLTLIYPIIALMLARLAFGYDVLPLLFPLVAGFALVGPLAATGMYELSRRREAGLDTSWAHAFDIFRSPAVGSIATIGVLLMAIFIAWLRTAQAIYTNIFGDLVPASIADFAHQVLATPDGWTLIVVGTGVGFGFAAVVLIISAFSIPMVLDRHVGVATAITTSARAVLANPLSMALWGLIVAVSLAIGSIPFFFGLAVVLPVLGHATWHLYRKAVAP